MSTSTGNVVEKITDAGSSDEGRYVRLSIALKGGSSPTLFFPYQMMPTLMTGLTAASTAAHGDRVQALGSEQNVADMEGIGPQWPNGYQLARGKDPVGKDFLLVRFKKDGAPIIDVALDFAGSEQLVKDILDELAKGPASTMQLQ